MKRPTRATAAGQAYLDLQNRARAEGRATQELRGLAERTAAIGGTIHSGPVPAGGWRLSAELPATT